MSIAEKQIPDPSTGVAAVAIASSPGQPGGHVLTEADIPDLLIGGAPLAEVESLQLTSSQHLEEIAKELVEANRLPAERFTFLR